MKTITFEVKGMMCAHCEQRVTKALQEVQGIRECTASANDNNVICSYDEQAVTIDKIKATIEDSGYDVIAMTE